MPDTATLGELDNLERELQDEQRKLDSKAARLIQAREMIQQISKLLEEINEPKERANTLPSAAEIRSVARAVLTKKKYVEGSEFMVLLHQEFGIPVPNNITDSPIASRVYQVLNSLKNRGYLRRLGKNKRRLAATARGKQTKSWG
tara:strand:- start:25 stop:459 length:435 start_codon:yes stop_codon:yes gene_type:complete